MLNRTHSIKTTTRLLSAMLLGWALAGSAHAEKLMVVVNPRSGLKELSKSELVNIYMGRQKVLEGESTAFPLDISGANLLKARFYNLLLQKKLAEINSYWARLIFSGQGSPPRQLDDFSQIKTAIMDNVGAIGYLPDSEPIDGLKVVLTLDGQ